MNVWALTLTEIPPSELMHVPCVPTMCQALQRRWASYRKPLRLALTGRGNKLEQTSDNDNDNDDSGHGLNPKTSKRGLTEVL